MTQETKPRYLSSSPVDSVCQTRSEILDRLASTLEQLGRAKLNLSAFLDDEGMNPLDFVISEVEQLRSDCGIIRAELEYHRTVHGC